MPKDLLMLFVEASNLDKQHEESVYPSANPVGMAWDLQPLKLPMMLK
jgi:hypothetical protein